MRGKSGGIYDGGIWGQVQNQLCFGFGGAVFFVEHFAGVGVNAGGFVAAFHVGADALVLLVDGGQQRVAHLNVIEKIAPDGDDGAEKAVEGGAVGGFYFGVGDAGVVEAAEELAVGGVGGADFVDEGFEVEKLDVGQTVGVEVFEDEVGGHVLGFEALLRDDADAAGHGEFGENIGRFVARVGGVEAQETFEHGVEGAECAVCDVVGLHDAFAAHGFFALMACPLELQAGGMFGLGDGVVDASAELGVVDEQAGADEFGDQSHAVADAADGRLVVRRENVRRGEGFEFFHNVLRFFDASLGLIVAADLSSHGQ